MGIDEETERPAEQPAGDTSKAGESAAADEQPTGDGDPVTDGHSEEWRANARQAGEKIRAMFKS
jgi:hypothetical protein